MNSRVLVARKNLKLTQEQLAKSVGVNHADVVRVEKHGWTPPPEIRKRFAKALRDTEASLFGVTSVESESRP